MFKQRMVNVWNNTSNLKRLVVVLISLMLVLCVPASKLTTKLNEFYVNVTVEGQKNEDSSSYEAWITEILVDEKAIDLSTLPLSQDWSYHPEKDAIWCTASEGNPSDTLVIGPYQGNQSVRFFVEGHQWSGMLRFETPSQVHLEDLYAAEAKINSCYFEAQMSPVNWDEMNLIDYLLLFGGYILLFILCAVLLIILPGKENVQFAVCYATVSILLWLTSDLISPARSTLLFLGVLSCGTCYVTVTRWKHQTMQKYGKIGTMIVICCVCFYASFASFGYRLFIQGDYLVFSRERVIYLLAGTVWFVPVVLTALFILEKCGHKVLQNNIEQRILSKPMVGFIASIISLVCLSVSYAGFYPGHFPLDAVVQLEQAKTNLLTNWHPVIHTLLMKLVLIITGKASCVVYAQLIAFAALIGRVATIPYEYGVKAKKIFWVVAVFALLPNQAATNISPLKDFLFSYTLVWGSILLFELALDPLKLKKISYMIQMILCMYLMKELRHNGILPLAFLCVILCIVGIKYRKRIKHRVVACILAAIIAIGVTDGPVFTALKVAENPIKPYVTMFCAVGSCLNKGKTLSEQTMERLQDVMSMDNWINYYGRFVGHDNYRWGGGENRMDLSSFSAVESFEIYFEALLKHPDIVVKDRLDGMNIMWDVSQPDDEGNFNARIFDMIVANSNLGLSENGIADGTTYYVHTPVADFYRDWTYFAFPGERAEDQVTDMLLWRSGAYLIFFLILAIYWTKNRLHRMWWAAMPMLGNIAAMVLVLYHQSFRYIYFIQLCVLTLTLMTFLMQRKQQENTNNAVFENV